MKRIFFATLMMVLVVGASAQKNASKKADTKTPTEADCVSVPDFSYMFGMAQTNGLKPWLQKQQGVDTLTYMNDFIKGFNEYASKIKDPKAKAYLVGMNIAQQVMEQMYAGGNKQITDNPDSAFIDKDQFLKGFVASLTGNSKVTPDSAAHQAERQMAYYHAQLMEKKYGENRRAGEKFLEENKKMAGVVTLPSGVQYKVVKAGTGEKPLATSKVEVNYEGRLIDGTVFDSSYKRKKSQEFSVNGVIKGFSEALQLMPVGSEWEIYIPWELAYGDAERQGSPIKPYSALIFKTELLSVKAAPQPKVPGKTTTVKPTTVKPAATKK